MIAGVVVLWIGGFFLFFGRHAFQAALFPLLVKAGRLGEKSFPAGARVKFKAAYVSGPPTSGRGRVRRDEGGHVQGILPFTMLARAFLCSRISTPTAIILELPPL